MRNKRPLVHQILGPDPQGLPSAAGGSYIAAIYRQIMRWPTAATEDEHKSRQGVGTCGLPLRKRTGRKRLKRDRLGSRKRTSCYLESKREIQSDTASPLLISGWTKPSTMKVGEV
jgi:hypothetical protein